MDILSIGLLCLLHVSPIAKAGVVARLSHCGLAPRYAFFSAGLLISAACQCCLIFAWWHGGYRMYAKVWAVTTPMQMAATLAVCLESIWMLAAHFPKTRNLVILLLMFGGFMSLFTVLPASLVLPGEGLLAVRRHWKAVVWTLLAVSRAMLDGAEPAMRHNARMHSTGILLALAGSVGGDLVLSVSKEYWAQGGGKVLLLGLPLAACWWWAQMRPEGESFTPTPGPTLEELDADMERIEERIREFRNAGGE